ncbi:sn-glycerol-3-phosphate ABC transporter ATP-binding protein UgpC [Arsenicitalea aurantiaca]|uniref:sn-glycerol-3-phosphate ABC transporter ATP-binding protein UgpC n=1 Tax=Arsenicitalea aurantiaca TaxID=1783274 RepID=A0A433XE97_9HYPH|nr:sn-glycerol-3-phosphate ABC transporter ATP-binding protein UgpC [Arsenicitalea aurantiaca]RUT32435.1 sn-glycerol-3-phosphate ABC transporter ATP-binding protein UgpC [Arsenicitalea aurantiaca]
MASVELLNVRKSYGPVAVIHDLDLTVADGEFLALVGPSGCGKSTLLRMIAGLEDITGGEVRIDDKTVNTVDPKGRNVAMVFQNYALYPHMTVRDNISLNLRLSRLPRAEIEARVRTAAELLDIGSLLDRRPSQLSGGQRQRVAMGRAIVRNPAVFLFDEPLSNLDAKLRVQMRTEIKAFHTKVATTSIYVTHDQIEAMTLADRIVVMNAGRIEQVGTPIELYQSPSNIFVAGFIGSPAMNILQGELLSTDGGLAVSAIGSQLTTLAAAAGAAGQHVKVGIRPEHLTLAGPGEVNRVSATIAHVEPTGAQTHLLVDAAGQMLTVVLNDIASVKRGDAVELSVRPDRIYLFDDATGQRLGAL